VGKKDRRKEHQIAKGSLDSEDRASTVTFLVGCWQIDRRELNSETAILTKKEPFGKTNLRTNGGRQWARSWLVCLSARCEFSFVFAQITSRIVLFIGYNSGLLKKRTTTTARHRRYGKLLLFRGRERGTHTGASAVLSSRGLRSTRDTKPDACGEDDDDDGKPPKNRNRTRRVSWRFITAVPIKSKNQISYIKCALFWRRRRRKTAKPPDPCRAVFETGPDPRRSSVGTAAVPGNQRTGSDIKMGDSCGEEEDGEPPDPCWEVFGNRIRPLTVIMSVLRVHDCSSTKSKNC